jgi:tetratricopeptide (TPR) repeat protein
MASTARIDELKKKFDENPRRYFAPLANEFRKAGDAGQAVMICEEFLPQQPGHMSGHIVYGQALFDLGRMDDARTVFETALTLDPENLIALRHLGDIARANGDLESGRHWYRRVLESDPRNEEVQALIASLDAGPASAPPSSGAVSSADVEQSTTVEFAPAFDAPAPSFEEPPVTLSPLPSAPPAPAESLLELDMVDEHALGTPPEPAAPQDTGLADGFEPMEFTAPASSTSAGGGLEDQLESAEFSAPQASVAPLDGLEETAIGAFEARPGETSQAAPRSDETAPAPLPDLEPTADFGRMAAAEEPPVDIPPEVIAAEAELIDAREAAAAVTTAPSPVNAEPPLPELPVDSAPPGPPPRVTPSQPFVTETMAELYMKQGFREQALDVYKLLLAASPENQRLRERVAELQPRDDADTGPNVRDFFARLAARRPGDSGAAAIPPASDDFASFDSFETVPTAAPATAPPAEPSGRGPVAPELAGLPMLDDGPGPEPETETDPVAQEAPPREGDRRGDGSIDALFGQRPAGGADDSAASALAQAFGNESTEPPPISGRPARAAAGEISLDSVFRDGGARPPRSAQSFSFDQFFSECAASESPADAGASPTPSQGTGAQPEPAERSADDIEQFNSWLQGLKPR